MPRKPKSSPPPDSPGASSLAIVRLRELMRHRGYTYREIAERTRRDVAGIYRALNGQGNPSLALVEDVLRAIGAKWADLD